MDGIKIDVTGNIAKVTEKPRRITSGTIGLPVVFTFDDQWDGLSKKAVFRTGHFSIVCDLNEEENTVPWEVLVFPNMWLSIGVYGVNEVGTVSIPTIWVNVSVIQPGTVPDGASPAEPTPPVWQRIEDEVNRIGDVVDQVNEEYADTKDKCDKTKLQVDQLEKNITPLIVTLDESTGKASHTSAEIFGHCNKGGMIFLNHSNNYIPFTFASQGSALFEAFNETILLIFEIKSDGSYSVNDVEYATADDIGDIATSLDGIIALQQSYIREDI